MRIIRYRNVPFVDRENEEKDLLSRFEEEPEKILFVYGPKSSGKTTLIEYLVENVLEKNNSFYVNYVNFRRHAISNYNSFLDVYFQPIEDENKPFIEKALEYLPVRIGRFLSNVSLPVKGFQFSLNIELYDKLVAKQVDPFYLLLKILQKIKTKKMPILILDEVQILEGIYMNGEIQKRHLLTEFLNFLVSLTKETHLAHVVVVTSETLFVEKLYNHSKLAETSDFYLIGHLDFKQVKEWLNYEGIEDKKIINLIWEYVGGSAHRINSAIKILKKGNDLKMYLLNEAKIYRGKISHFIADKLEKLEEKRMLKSILKEMLDNDFILKDNENNLQTKVINKAIEHEFLFLNPREEKIGFNSQIVKKGVELFFES